MPSVAESAYESRQSIPHSKLEKGTTGSKSSRQPSNVDIIDIRQSAVEINLKEEIHKLLRPREGPRKLPTLLLYDEKGLQLFEEVREGQLLIILRRSAAAIAKAIPSGSLVLELGSGNLRKVALLLQALEDAGKKIDYYALDLSRDELSRTLAQLPTFRHIRCHGLLGTYDDGREWLSKPQISSKRKFILNGLAHANEVLGHKAFELGDWQVVGEYIYDSEGGRHQAFYSPVHDTVVLGENIRAQERVQVEQSLKYSKEGCGNLWKSAGMIEADRWMSEDEDYGEWSTTPLSDLENMGLVIPPRRPFRK
ncbi:hypothetical protein AAE478_001645 [Parahypoxylon ruwenzoriense]